MHLGKLCITFESLSGISIPTVADNQLSKYVLILEYVHNGVLLCTTLCRFHPALCHRHTTLCGRDATMLERRTTLTWTWSVQEESSRLHIRLGHATVRHNGILSHRGNFDIYLEYRYVRIPDLI